MKLNQCTGVLSHEQGSVVKAHVSSSYPGIQCIHFNCLKKSSYCVWYMPSVECLLKGCDGLGRSFSR